MSTKSLRILGIAGSLRRQSYNRAALEAVKELLPEGVTLETFDIGGLPFFNQDEEKSPPPALVDFKQKIRAADAILFVTPEYNYSIPGVLKNAIDCASRPYGDNAWDDKPAAIMGASVSTLGTGRAQYQLRQMMVWLNMHAMNGPEVMIATANEKIDKDGKLTDAKTREMIGKQLVALAAWTRRLGTSDDSVGAENIPVREVVAGNQHRPRH